MGVLVIIFPVKTPAIMWTVCAALSPAAAAAAYERGAGALLQVAIAVVACVLCESLCLLCRRRPVGETLQDGSAVVAALIVGLSLPPLAPWHVAFAASAFAIVLAKHCYGGLGNNPFNPAMAGYALAFLSFPADFGNWHPADLQSALQHVFLQAKADATSMPTPLLAERLGVSSAPPSFWFGAACVLGGIPLLLLRAADWRLPASFILGAVLMLQIFGATMQESYVAMMSGGMLLAAFFVITDPVTAATTRRGRWLYGGLCGALIIYLRQTGIHADSIAFAVLLCNLLAPLTDRLAHRLNKKQ